MSEKGKRNQNKENNQRFHLISYINKIEFKRKEIMKSRVFPLM